MARHTQIALSLAVTFALAMPAMADAQATRRGGSSGSGSSGSGSGSGSSSGSSGSSGSTTRSAPPTSETRTAVRRPSNSSSSSRETASSRAAASRSGGDSVDVRARGGSAVGRPGSTVGLGGASGVMTRDRDGRPVRGVATLRPDTDVRILYFPFVGPWGRWTPWYNAGFGYGGFGYFGYDPYFSPYYSRYPYGLYSRPYLGGGGDYEEAPDEERYGSIRLRVSPDTARVYIDGALVGTVDDFNGLTDHLELVAGVHTIEIRADGYETYVGEVNVEGGKTLTERLTLTRRQ